MSAEFLSMTELGKLYGVSSHQVGKWLVALGLRTSEKKPSKTSFQNGFVEQRPSRQPGTYFWSWNAVKTMRALDEAGHSRVAPVSTKDDALQGDHQQG